MGGAGLAIRTAGGSFSDPNGSDSTHAQKIFEISLVQNRSAGMQSIRFKTNTLSKTAVNRFLQNVQS